MEDNSHEEEEEEEEDEDEEERGDVDGWQSGTQRLQNGTRDSDDADSESECGDHESENDFARSRLVAGLKKDQVELPCDHSSWEARRNYLEHLAG